MSDDLSHSREDSHADERFDLRALDPDTDPGAEARFVDAVMERVTMRSSRYPPPADPLWGVWSLARPLVAAAAVVLLVAGVVTERSRRPDAPRTVAEAVGIPRELETAVMEAAPR